MTLHPRANLDWLRRAARELLNGLKRGEEAALTRLRNHLPGVAAPTLAHAQTVIAREQGLASWPALKTEVEARAARRGPKPPSPLRTKALAQLVRLLAAARTGDPKALADLPGYGSRVGKRVRDILETRPADRALLVGTFLRGLSHPNPRVRFECAHALDTYGDASCRAALVALIDDPVPRVRWMAMHALSCDACKDDLFGDDDEVRRRIAERALGDPSVQVRRHAVVAVGIAGGPSAAATLERVLAQESDTVVLRNAVAMRRTLQARAD
jgi:hypothetical protein